MDKLAEYKDNALGSLSDMWPEILRIGMNVIGALAVLFIGWIIAKVVVKIIKKALKLAKANRLDDKLNEIEIVSSAYNLFRRARLWK